MTLLLIGLSCTKSTPVDEEPRFPDTFRFGSATAGFQVDMGCPTRTDCIDDQSDWYAWVTTPEIVDESALFVSGESVEVGPGMWELFEADVAQMAADGHTAYRMSLEWSRLFPDPATAQAQSVDDLATLADQDALIRYHQMFQALEDVGIEPIITLNHYTLPLWVHDGVLCHTDPECVASGWVDSDRIVPMIALYSGFVAREFGGSVDTWFTLNEPFATTLSGYLQPGEDRSAPPGRSFDVEATVAVLRAQIEGHAAMADAVRSYDTVDADGDGRAQEVGIVLNMVDIQPSDPDNPDDQRGADHADYLYHRLYLDALTSGAWDDDLDGIPDRNRPELAGRLDLIGINYYNELTVLGLPFAPVSTVPAFDFYPEFSWEPHPEGLAAVIRNADQWGLPIWVTENGTPFVEDRGVEVLEGHLDSLLEVVDEGLPVRGYLYWSWVDNYEWNHGLDLRFGLYALDPITKARSPRPVAERYREIIRSRRVNR